MNKRNGLASEIITNLVNELKENLESLKVMEKSTNDTLSLIQSQKTHVENVLEQVEVAGNE